MWPAFILLVAAYSPGLIRSRAKHPMLAAVKIWALAHLLAKSAAEQGRDSARWLAAAALDRYLVYSGKPQKYGTQTVLDPKTEKMVNPPVDPATTDAERAKWHVEPLSAYMKRVK